MATWTQRGSIKGAPGDDGADGVDGTDGVDGRAVLNGSGVPDGGSGIDGDFYIRTGVWTVYGPKASGSWGSPTDLIGPQGIQGEPGVDGTDGATSPPSGAAGGALAGTYPDPDLASADLAGIAALSPSNGTLLERIAGAWAASSYATVKSHLSLDAVDNTSDADKPVSTAQQTALDLKAPIDDPTFTGIVTALSLIKTPYSKAYASAMSFDANDGDSPYTTLSSGNVASVAITNGSLGQMIMWEVTATGGARTVTFTLANTCGLTSPVSIASGKTAFFGFRYSQLLNAWVIISYGVTP